MKCWQAQLWKVVVCCVDVILEVVFRHLHQFKCSSCLRFNFSHFCLFLYAMLLLLGDPLNWSIHLVCKKTFHFLWILSYIKQAQVIRASILHSIGHSRFRKLLDALNCLVMVCPEVLNFFFLLFKQLLLSFKLLLISKLLPLQTYLSSYVLIHSLTD